MECVMNFSKARSSFRPRLNWIDHIVNGAFASLHQQQTSFPCSWICIQWNKIIKICSCFNFLFCFRLYEKKVPARIFFCRNSDCNRVYGNFLEGFEPEIWLSPLKAQEIYVLLIIIFGPFKVKFSHWASSKQKYYLHVEKSTREKENEVEITYPTSTVTLSSNIFSLYFPNNLKYYDNMFLI